MDDVRADLEAAWDTTPAAPDTDELADGWSRGDVRDDLEAAYDASNAKSQADAVDAYLAEMPGLTPDEATARRNYFSRLGEEMDVGPEVEWLLRQPDHGAGFWQEVENGNGLASILYRVDARVLSDYESLKRRLGFAA